MGDGIRYREGTAERLPFFDDSFDFAFSRVALVYAYMPDALREIRRVLRSGAGLWLLLHPLSYTLQELRRVVKGREVTGTLGRLAVIANGLALHATGRLPRYRVRETWQSIRGMRLALHRAGFEDVRVVPAPRFIITARKV